MLSPILSISSKLTGHYIDDLKKINEETKERLTKVRGWFDENTAALEEVEKILEPNNKQEIEELIKDIKEDIKVKSIIPEEKIQELEKLLVDGLVDGKKKEQLMENMKAIRESSKIKTVEEKITELEKSVKTLGLKTKQAYIEEQMQKMEKLIEDIKDKSKTPEQKLHELKQSLDDREMEVRVMEGVKETWESLDTEAAKEELKEAGRAAR